MRRLLDKLGITDKTSFLVFVVDGITPAPEYLELMEKNQRGKLTNKNIKSLERPHTI